MFKNIKICSQLFELDNCKLEHWSSDFCTFWQSKTQFTGRLSSARVHWRRTWTKLWISFKTYYFSKLLLTFVIDWRDPDRMGAYLSVPITTKETSTEENELMAVASCSMQGWRVTQEVIIIILITFPKINYVIHTSSVPKKKSGSRRSFLVKNGLNFRLYYIKHVLKRF